MGNQFKRMIAMAMTVAMILCLVPLSAFAADVHTDEIKDLTGSYINPMYEQYADTHTVQTFNTDVTTFDTLKSFNSISKAGAYVRDQMEARNTTICFQYTVAADDYETNLRSAMSKIIAEAWKHTGVPTEGDYLHWQIIQYGWGTEYGEYIDCDNIRFDMTFNFQYFTTSGQEEHVDAFADAFINAYGDLENHYEKVCAIYDYLCTYVTYDYDNLYDDTYYLKHSAYAAAVNDTAVCQGYALLFYRLALEMGIDCRFVGGDGGGPHAWNIVQLGDLYYYLDSTWDAGYSSYDWFLLGSNNFTSHTRYDEFNTTAFNKAHPISTTDFNPSSYVAYPTLKGTVVSSTGNPKLSWNKIDNAAKYQVYRSTSGKAGTFKLLTTTTKTSVVNSKVDRGQTYYYKIRTIYNNGTKGEFSKTVKLTAKCAAPTISVKTVASTGKPKISWSAVDGADKYDIYRASSKDGEYTKIGSTTKTYAINTKAVAGKTYYYKVKAINSNKSAANSSLSSYKYITCDCAQPVVNISNVASTGKIKLSWTAVDGADKYEIYSATSKNGEYTKIGTTTKTYATNTKAVAGKTYYYKVKAVNSNVSSATSAFSEIVFRTCDCAQPVVNISNVASTGKIKLSWTAVDGADKYEIYSASSKNGTYSKIGTTTKSYAVHTKAVAGKTYYYKVKAVNSNVSSATSAFSEIVSRTCDLAQPVVTVKLNSNGKPKLSWNAVDGADKYEIYRATSKDGTYTLLNTITGTSATNTKAVSGKTYYYKVKAIDADKSAANSAYSVAVSITSK